jgi:hypothetical protein
VPHATLFFVLVQPEALEGVVMQAGADIDSHVMAVLLQKFQLGAHCEALKRYLLLGQVLPLAINSISISLPYAKQSLFVKPITILVQFAMQSDLHNQFVKGTRHDFSWSEGSAFITPEHSIRLTTQDRLSSNHVGRF